MKLSVMTLCALHELGKPGMSLDKLYRAAAEAGFEGIDLSTIELNQLGRAGAKAALEAAGIPMSSHLCFTSLFSMDDQQFAQAIRQCRDGIDFCREVGCNFMMLVPLIGTDEHGMPLTGVPNASRQALADRLVEGVKQVLPYAKENGITLGLEDDPHTNIPLCTAEELDYVLSRLPEVKLIYDSTNMLVVGEDPMAYFDRFADRIGYLHLTDAVIDESRTGDARLVAVPHGTGRMDFPALFRKLRAMDYQGYMAFEGNVSISDWPDAVQKFRGWISEACQSADQDQP